MPGDPKIHCAPFSHHTWQAITVGSSRNHHDPVSVSSRKLPGNTTHGPNRARDVWVVGDCRKPCPCLGRSNWSSCICVDIFVDWLSPFHTHAPSLNRQ